VILNAEGNVVWLNPAAESMLGFGLIGSLWVDITQKAFVLRVDDGHEVSLANGRQVHVAISSLESLPGTLITLSDITVSKDYEKAKENDKRLMAIGTMTAQLAHQIRTPLSSAMLYTEHLCNLNNLEDRTRTWLTRLQDCHQSIEQQIQDLLLFARGTSISLKPTPVSEWCQKLRQRAQPHLDTHHAEFVIDNRIINPMLYIHGESLIGVMLNLIINALQSAASSVHLILTPLKDNGVRLTVEDNGVGMSKDIQEQAFLPFYTTKAKGTGLGLAVVYAVMKAHGGKVTLESMQDVGTSVHLYFPPEP
jgi:two-component system sensor histidine kinase FlrB